MPDIIRVRFLGSTPHDIPLAGRVVEPDTLFELAGRVVEDLEDADHVVIEVGNPPDTRLLQRALFRVENPKTATTKVKE